MDFIVLSSSRGTTFQAVIETMQKHELKAKCLGLITDKNDRLCIEKAKAAGIPFVVLTKDDSDSREEYDQKINTAISSLIKDKDRTQIVIAALGWMFIFTPWFIAQWKNRIINVHPALLPDFGGKGMYGIKVHQAVLDAKKKESGITIHVMDEGVDTGKILLQKTCPVLADDTAETLRERVQALEREWYPKVLHMIEDGKLLF